MLSGLSPIPDPDILVGLDRPDDAGIYRLNEEIALIQTVDYITPIVDDPFMFGRIAGANALSDIWTMGGRPICAMNVVCFPSEGLSLEILQETLRGGIDSLSKAGCALVGGHSVDDPEFKYGMSVTGLVHPEHFLTNRGAVPGDLMVLTKAIGTGIVAIAVKAGLAEPETVNASELTMTTLNRRAGELMLEHNPHACTDITGFGLVGHAAGMAEGEPITINISTGSVPLLPGTADLVRMGMVPATIYNNRKHFSSCIETDDEADRFLVDILYDPQTSGGLLVAMSPEDAEKYTRAMHSEGFTDTAIIGNVTEREDGRIHVGA